MTCNYKLASSEDYLALDLPKNFRPTIGGNNYRSGKIPTRKTIDKLAADFGVKTIVNLAGDSMAEQGDDDLKCGTYSVAGEKTYSEQKCEPMWAQMAGIEYIYIPLYDEGPTDSDWERISAVITKGNALIHCSQGADRSGAVIGRFRLENQTLLSLEQVMEEAFAYGFKKQGPNYGYGKDPTDPNKFLRQWMQQGRR